MHVYESLLIAKRKPAESRRSKRNGDFEPYKATQKSLENVEERCWQETMT